ncbi:glycosyltransferase family 2 protein [Moritella sp. F3]|uniref:glycosyltransferase family 2 protein n=1 Tax=Moritella sp. F3 TaxID=2718882 RepID=UPI0018E19ECC|nr:glycosyltransferase family 2 protein [Moritella sp. F3]
MKVSIITINYNNSDGLERTIISVLSQKYKNMELIIVDGGSTDSSLSILEKYKDRIDVIISEKDDGVYDAMNKGIDVSSGKWINFMNSGDVFHRNETVENIFKYPIKSDVKLIYGTQYKNGLISSVLPSQFLELGIIHACHQAMFFDSNIRYNLEYSVYSDYDLVARIYKTNPSSLLYINEVICEFEGGGISSVVSKEKRLDKYKSIYKNFGFKNVLASIVYMISNKLIKK